MGVGHKCEMPGCKKPAFTVCDNQLNYLYLPCLPTIWTGCGKKLCPNHISINYNKVTGYPTVHHCRLDKGDIEVNGGFEYIQPAYSDCGLGYNTGLCKTMIHYIIIVLFPLMVLMGIFLATPASFILGVNKLKEAVNAN
jgi:hypothetical protein